MFDTKGLSYADGTPLADPRSPTACLCINVQVQNHKLRLGLLKGSLASGTEQSGFACLDTHLDLIKCYFCMAWRKIKINLVPSFAASDSHYKPLLVCLCWLWRIVWTNIKFLWCTLASCFQFRWLRGFCSTYRWKGLDLPQTASHGAGQRQLGPCGWNSIWRT